VQERGSRVMLVEQFTEVIAQQPAAIQPVHVGATHALCRQRQLMPETLLTKEIDPALRPRIRLRRSTQHVVGVPTESLRSGSMQPGELRAEHRIRDIGVALNIQPLQSDQGKVRSRTNCPDVWHVNRLGFPNLVKTGGFDDERRTMVDAHSLTNAAPALVDMRHLDPPESLMTADASMSSSNSSEAAAATMPAVIIGIPVVSLSSWQKP